MSMALKQINFFGSKCLHVSFLFSLLSPGTSPCSCLDIFRVSNDLSQDEVFFDGFTNFFHQTYSANWRTGLPGYSIDRLTLLVKFISYQNQYSFNL